MTENRLISEKANLQTLFINQLTGHSHTHAQIECTIMAQFLNSTLSEDGHKIRANGRNKKRK